MYIVMKHNQKKKKTNLKINKEFDININVYPPQWSETYVSLSFNIFIKEKNFSEW